MNSISLLSLTLETEVIISAGSVILKTIEKKVELRSIEMDSFTGVIIGPTVSSSRMDIV